MKYCNTWNIKQNLNKNKIIVFKVKEEGNKKGGN